jgi:hypothetical protein
MEAVGRAEVEAPRVLVEPLLRRLAVRERQGWAGPAGDI